VIGRCCDKLALTAMTVALALVSARADAQGTAAEVRVDTLQPPSPNSPFTRAEGPADSFDTGIGYGFRFTTDYGYGSLRTNVTSGPDAGELKPVEHALLGHVGAGLTPLDWLSLELGYTFAAFETGEDDTRLNRFVAAGKPGVGDPRVGLHLRPYLSDELDLAIGVRFWAPIGMPQSYLTSADRFFRLELVPAVSGDVDIMLYGCTLGISPLFFAGRDGDRSALSCAALFKLAPTILAGVEPHLALFAFSGTEPGATSESTPGLGSADIAVQFEPLASIAFRLDNFLVTAAGGPGLSNSPGAPAARAMLTLAWNARGERVEIEDRPDDRDLDGIIDDYDACPDEAGSKDRRGCPDPLDTDGDGIVDGDACPDAPGANYDNPDANGCPDRDNDHVADPVDDCPLEPGDETLGCPQHARLVDGDFVIDPPIAFGPSRARLSKRNRVALEEVVRTLRANPNLEQLTLKLGTRRAGRALTDRRAEALLKILNEQNVDSSRYSLELDDGLKAGRVDVHVVR
jgi:hypothetical protein